MSRDREQESSDRTSLWFLVFGKATESKIGSTFPNKNQLNEEIKRYTINEQLKNAFNGCVEQETEPLTWEDHSRAAAIAISDNPCQVVRVLDKSTEAECTDTPIPRKAADSTRPKPTSHWICRSLPRSYLWRTAASPSSSLAPKQKTEFSKTTVSIANSIFSMGNYSVMGWVDSPVLMTSGSELGLSCSCWPKMHMRSSP